MLAKYRTVQVRKYKQFIEKQDAAQLVSFYDNANLPSLLGGKKFFEWVKATFFKGKIDLDIPQSKLLVPDRQVIMEMICDFYGVSEKGLIAMRRGVMNEPRDVAIYLLRTVCGTPLLSIGEEFGMTRYSSVSSAVDRVKKKQQGDRKRLKRICDIKKLIEKNQTKT